MVTPRAPFGVVVAVLWLLLAAAALAIDLLTVLNFTDVMAGTAVWQGCYVFVLLHRKGLL